MGPVLAKALSDDPTLGALRTWTWGRCWSCRRLVSQEIAISLRLAPFPRTQREQRSAGHPSRLASARTRFRPRRRRLVTSGAINPAASLIRTLLSEITSAAWDRSSKNCSSLLRCMATRRNNPALCRTHVPELSTQTGCSSMLSPTLIMKPCDPTSSALRIPTMSAGHSELMSATCSDSSRPAVPIDVGRGGGSPAGRW